jgi:hypothetical protein
MANEFKESYQQGREETKEQLKRIKRGEGMTDDYSFKFAKPFVYLGIFLCIAGFFYLWLIIKWSFFVSLVVGLVGGWVLSCVILLVAVGLLMLIAKSRKI